MGQLGITVEAMLYGTDDGFDTLLLLCTLSDTMKRRLSQSDPKEKRAECSMSGAENGIILMQSFSLFGGEYDAGDEVIRNRHRERKYTKYEAATGRCNAEVQLGLLGSFGQAPLSSLEAEL